MTTLMSGKRLVIQTTTLIDEQKIEAKCEGFFKKHEQSGYHLAFASLNEFNPDNNIYLKNTKCMIWKGDDLIKKCALPLTLLCDPQRSDEALKWLDTLYGIFETKRKNRFEEQPKKKKSRK